MNRPVKFTPSCQSNHSVWANGLTRRDLLRVGSIGVASTVVSGVAAKDQAASPPATADSVIYLWMGGGVTHIDSFDPKPEAPEEVRGTLTAIPTSLPGVHYCETMPHMARVADKITLVRSFSHDSNDHLLSQAFTLSGRKVAPTQLFSEPNIGAIVSYLQGPRNGLPGYIAVPGITRPGPPPHNLFVGGWLGGQHAPFCVGGVPAEPDFTKNLSSETIGPEAFCDEDLRPKTLDFPQGLGVDRLRGRAGLRARLDHALRVGDAAASTGAVDEHYLRAFDLLTSESIRDAFDITREPDSIRERYGRTKIGSRCLLARRLVESGARFVMVDYGYDPEYGNLWDNHNAPGQNYPHICETVKHGYHLAGMDKAFAALLTDLDERGMLERTLVVFLTEFGRTPTINSRGGRDHWGAAGSIFFAGGGAKRGQVIGQTDKTAAYPIDRGYTPGDLAATIYAALGIDPHQMVHDRQNRPMFIVPDGDTIPGVLG